MVGWRRAKTGSKSFTPIFHSMHHRHPPFENPRRVGHPSVMSPLGLSRILYVARATLVCCNSNMEERYERHSRSALMPKSGESF